MSGYVGRAPGTTTLRLGAFPEDRERDLGHKGSPWSPRYPNPAQRHLPRGSTVVGSMMAPHDLELARIYGYTPYMQGWTVGRFTSQPRGIEIDEVESTGLSGFGQEAQTQADLERQLEMKRIAEELKTLKWNRIWSGVSAAAAVGALLISIAAFRRGR